MKERECNDTVMLPLQVAVPNTEVQLDVVCVLWKVVLEYLFDTAINSACEQSLS